MLATYRSTISGPITMVPRKPQAIAKTKMTKQQAIAKGFQAMPFPLVRAGLRVNHPRRLVLFLTFTLT